MSLKELNTFRNNSDKFESLYTLLIYDLDVQNVIDTLYRRLEFLKSIKDSFKRDYQELKRYEYS